ncbi:MAG: nucleotidyltransferase family protein, partial [Verrucomicrobiota bacterium]
MNQDPDRHPCSSVGIVILAAGESSRLGRPKQLLEYRGKSLLRHTVDVALAVPGSAVAVVLGAFAEIIRTELDGVPVMVTINSDWGSGMAGSLQTGLSVLLAAHPDMNAVIFLLCDQPLLSTGTLENLIRTHLKSGCKIVASEYGDSLGVPALFQSSLFPRLLALQGSEGARHLIMSHSQETVAVPFEDGIV